jgi:catechol 2,3-dioxygenase-like lactoylglutathione lyase family enzyme
LRYNGPSARLSTLFSVNHTSITTAQPVAVNGGLARLCLMSAFGAERIDHVTIIVTDLKRADDFYRRVLQLTEVPRPESFDFPGSWYQIGPTVLHLMGKPQPDSSSVRHFCLWVRDVRAAASHAESQNWPISWQTKHKIRGIDRFFLHDPDGNRVEVQGADGSGDPVFGTTS